LFYKPTFDVDFWELSPGQVLLWQLFDHLRSTDVEEFDFGQGAEAYKFRFANEVHKSLNFTIYAPTLRARAQRRWSAALLASKARIRRSPRLFAFADAARRRLARAQVALRRDGLLAAVKMSLPGSRSGRSVQWLVSVQTGLPNGDSRYRLSNSPLSVLAANAVAVPHLLTADDLEEARKRLARNASAWLMQRDGRNCALLWTRLADGKSANGAEIAPSVPSMLHYDTWPLTGDLSGRDLLAGLRQLGVPAKDADVPLFSVCSADLCTRHQLESAQHTKIVQRSMRVWRGGRFVWEWRAC
jgi:hypothetical protein